MSLRWLSVQQPSFFPEEAPPAPNAPKQELNADDILEILESDDEEQEVIDLDNKPDKPVRGKKDEKEEDKETPDDEQEEEDEEKDELAELEEELEGPDEEQLELVTPVRRAEILKKYPQLFKDFPYLEKAYYREQQFTEVFPTIEDARKAAEDSQTLGNFEKDIMKGNTLEILKAVKNEDEGAFHRIVDNYMSTIYQVDPTAYHHVVGNIQKYTIKGMVEEGRKTNNEVLINAAAILNQWVFGTSEYTPPTQLAKPQNNNPEKDEVKQERQRLVQERFESTRDSLQTRLTNSIQSTIAQNIDKNNSMSEYIRKNATREAYERLDKLIAGDRRFQSLKDKLWEAAFKENFSKASVDRIRSAYVSKAKTLLPAVIKAARNEALKGLGKRIKDDDKEGFEPSGERRPSTRTATSSSGNRGNDYAEKAKKIPRGMSTADYLMQD